MKTTYRNFLSINKVSVFVMLVLFAISAKTQVNSQDGLPIHFLVRNKKHPGGLQMKSELTMVTGIKTATIKPTI